MKDKDLKKIIKDKYDIVYRDPVGLYKINDIVSLVPGISINVFDEDNNIDYNCFDENGYCLPSVIRYFLIPKAGIDGNLLVVTLPLENNARYENDSWFYITDYLGFGLIKRPNSEEYKMINDWSEETIKSQGKPTLYLSLYGSIKNKHQPTLRMITVGNAYINSDNEEEINV